MAKPEYSSVPALVRAPVYQQLNDRLRELAAGMPAGERFLTEREIAEHFQVSRATANKALSNLVSERLLEFRAGRGTFVRPVRLDYDLRQLVSFTARALAAGKRPETKVLAFSGAGEEIYVERLRLADGVPLILERRHIVAKHCPGLTKADVAGSIYELWQSRYGLRIGGAEQTIGAVNITGRDARLLQVEAGSAGLLVTSEGQLAGGAPLWRERTLYRGDAYEFHNRLAGPKSAGPAVGRWRT